MNDADSKKMNEVRRPEVLFRHGRRYVDPLEMESYCGGAEDTISQLRAKVKEQDREIAELREDLAWAEDDAKEHKARVTEMEQELLWAADACEKAETRVKELETHIENFENAAMEAGERG